MNLKTTTLKQLQPLANMLGFGNMVSYKTMYGTKINTFSKKTCSVWMFTINFIEIEGKELIRGIEVNSTYFKGTNQIKQINKFASHETPITIEQAIALVKYL